MGWWQLLEAMQPSDSWAERQAGRVDCPRAKPGQARSTPMLYTGRGIDSQIRLRVALPSQPESLFGKLRVTWSYPSLSCPGKGAETVPTAAKSLFWPNLTRWARLHENTWKLYGPDVRPKKRVEKANTLQIKASGLFSQGTWGADLLQLRQQTVLPALELLLPLHPGRKSNMQPHSLLNADIRPSNQGT